MRASVTVLALLLAAPAVAQKPWEARIDLDVPVPVELPTVPATNPFAMPLAVQPVALATPLQEKFDLTITVDVAAYLDTTGTCRRVVFTRLPLPGIAAEIQESLLDTDFTPARMLGADVPTWAPLVIEVGGRIDRGEVLNLTVLPPDPSVPPVPEIAPSPAPDARDQQLAATPVEQLDRLPATRRFRTKVGGRTFRQAARLMVEIGPDGRCLRVVFLSCPEGLQRWLLESFAGWTFQPPQDRNGPTTAWVRLQAEFEVETGTLRADSLRVMRQSTYPRSP